MTLGLLGILMDVSVPFCTMVIIKYFFQPGHRLSWLYLRLLLDTMQLFCNKLIFPNDKSNQFTHNSLPVQSHCCPLHLLSLLLTSTSFFSSHSMDCLYKYVSSYVFSFIFWRIFPSSPSLLHSFSLSLLHRYLSLQMFLLNAKSSKRRWTWWDQFWYGLTIQIQWH